MEQENRTPSDNRLGRWHLHEEDIKLLEGQIEPICKKYNARIFDVWIPREPTHLGKDGEKHHGQIKTRRPEWFEHREGTTPIKYAEYVF
jgi:hypothetical protein